MLNSIEYGSIARLYFTRNHQDSCSLATVGCLVADKRISASSNWVGIAVAANENQSPPLLLDRRASYEVGMDFKRFTRYITL